MDHAYFITRSLQLSGMSRSCNRRVVALQLMHPGVLITEDLLVLFLIAHIRALIESYNTKLMHGTPQAWQLRRHLHKPNAV
jgi:hypothetical protein